MGIAGITQHSENKVEYIKKGFQKYKNITIENLAISSSQGFTNLKIPFRNQNIDYSDYEELYQLGTATIHEKNNLSFSSSFLYASTVMNEPFFDTLSISFKALIRLSSSKLCNVVIEMA